MLWSSVFAELTIVAKWDLATNLETELPMRFGKPSDKGKAIDATVFPMELAETVVFQQLTRGRVFLVSQDEISTLKVHIEDTQNKAALSVLKRHVEEVTSQMEKFLNSQGNHVTKVSIVIGEGLISIQNGEQLRWRGKAERSLKENALSKIYVPVATYVASILLGYQQDSALLNVLVALIALAVWALIDATFVAKSYKYDYQEG